MNFLDDYQPVEDRLRLFWEDHPYGRVITELLHHADGDYIVMASVYFGNELRNDPPTATGLAHDSTSSLPNNMKSSALEVAETSAIGRALANAGYAPKDKRPSREEMQKSSGLARPPDEAPGLGDALPSPGAERPDPDGEGEAPTGSGETSERAGAGEQLGGVAHPAPASELITEEPHEHVAGPQRLASGKALCIFERSDGTVCGRPFKPKPTIHTAPIDADEVRKDTA